MYYSHHETGLPLRPSLNPDGVVTIRSARLCDGVGARGGEVAEGGEKLLHLFLQHLVPPLGVILGALGVAQLYLRHGVFLPLLVQLLVQADHLRLQLQVPLLQAATKVKPRSEKETERTEKKSGKLEDFMRIAGAPTEAPCTF